MICTYAFCTALGRQDLENLLLSDTAFLPRSFGRPSRGKLSARYAGRSELSARYAGRTVIAYGFAMHAAITIRQLKMAVGKQRTAKLIF